MGIARRRERLLDHLSLAKTESLDLRTVSGLGAWTVFFPHCLDFPGFSSFFHRPSRRLVLTPRFALSRPFPPFANAEIALDGSLRAEVEQVKRSNAQHPVFDGERLAVVDGSLRSVLAEFPLPAPKQVRQETEEAPPEGDPAAT